MSPVKVQFGVAWTWTAARSCAIWHVWGHLLNYL